MTNYIKHFAACFAIAAACAVSPAAVGAAGDTPTVAGIWWANSYNPSMKAYLVGGGDIPLNDAGKQKYAENQAGLRGGSNCRSRAQILHAGRPATFACHPLPLPDHRCAAPAR